MCPFLGSGALLEGAPAQTPTRWKVTFRGRSECDDRESGACCRQSLGKILQKEKNVVHAHCPVCNSVCEAALRVRVRVCARASVCTKLCRLTEKKLTLLNYFIIAHLFFHHALCATFCLLLKGAIVGLRARPCAVRMDVC